MARTFLSVISENSEELNTLEAVFRNSQLDTGYVGSKNLGLKELIHKYALKKHLVFMRPSKKFMNVSSPKNLNKIADVSVIILGEELPEDLIGFLIEYDAMGFINPSDVSVAGIHEMLECIEKKGYVENAHIPAEHWLNKKPHIFPRPRPELTNGEEEVLRLLCHNFTVKEISDRLEKKEPAIRAHITNLREKLHAKSLLEIVIITMANTWVKIDPRLTSGKNPFL